MLYAVRGRNGRMTNAVANYCNNPINKTTLSLDLIPSGDCFGSDPLDFTGSRAHGNSQGRVLSLAFLPNHLTKLALFGKVTSYPSDRVRLLSLTLLSFKSPE